MSEACAQEQVLFSAAPMKNKEEDIIRAFSINRSPLTGFGHAKTAEGNGELGISCQFPVPQRCV
jgi:hypothetical protein